MAGVQPNKEYVLKYENFRGGLNLRDAEEDLAPNESPEMKNLLWRNGVLSSRRGLTYLNSAATRGTGLACFSGLWHGHFFFHAGTKIYACHAEDGTVTVAASGVPGYQGTFFLFGGDLYYKNKGSYIRITAVLSGGVWSFSGSRGAMIRR